MASSRSSAPESIEDRPTIRKLNDSVYELYKPKTGFVNLEIILFHGFQSENYEEAYLQTWMTADGSACWLNTWLAEEFPHSRIISVSYDSSIHVTDTAGRMDMYLVEENLAYSLIELEGIGQSCPVVLVGHSVGGLVMREVCVRAEEVGTGRMGPHNILYKTFLTNVKGTFFYSTPCSGTRVEPTSESTHQGPLLRYFELLSKDTASLISSFSKLRRQFGWITSGVIESNVTEDSKAMIRMPHPKRRLLDWEPRSRSLMVEEGSGRYDMDDFCVLSGQDKFTICKPKDRKSNNFLLLVTFTLTILEMEETVRQQWRSLIRLPGVFVNFPQRLERIVESLQLDRAEPSRIALVGMSGIGKTT